VDIATNEEEVAGSTVRRDALHFLFDSWVTTYPYVYERCAVRAHSRRKKRRKKREARDTDRSEERYRNKDLKRSLVGSYDHVGVSDSISFRGDSTMLHR
jgi:hypothetical protein